MISLNIAYHLLRKKLFADKIHERENVSKRQEENHSEEKKDKVL